MITKFNLKVFILLFLFFAFTTSIFAADFYVSLNGKDTNTGTKQSPFATIERAKKAVLEVIKNNEACTVWLADEIYRIEKPVEFNSADFGSNQAKITFRAIKGTKPVISGGIEISGWKKNENGFWIAELPEKGFLNGNPRELFIDGKRGVRARFPNNEYLRVKEVGADRRTNFFFERGEFPVPQEVQNVELVLLHDWSISRIGVKEIDLVENKLTAIDSIGAKNPDFFNLDHWEKNPRYYLENAIEFLDANFEWYFDSEKKIIFLKLPEDQSPAQFHISIPVSRGLIQINGTEKQALKNIHFEGIEFTNSAWTIPEKGYCGVQACHFDSRPLNNDWSVVPAAITAEWAENCSFVNCTFKNLGGSGLWFSTGSKNCKVNHSSFFDISGNGIMIGEGQDRLVNGKPWWQVAQNQTAFRNSVENCEVTECGKQFYGAVGIWCGLTAETTIKNNEIHHLPYSGISIGWMWSPVPTPCRANVIEGNHIHHILQILSDGGGIYMLGLQPESRLVNNHIHDVKINAGRAESNGMFLDEGTTDVLVANNLIYNIAKSPLRFHKATTNLVKNNYLFCSTENPPIRYNNTNEADIEKINNKVFNEGERNYSDELNKAITLWNEKKILAKNRSGFENSPRQKILFDFDWKFHRGNPGNGQSLDLKDNSWRNIDLPHDWSIEDLPGTNSPFDSAAIWGIDGGYLTGGTGWYRKSFEIPNDYSGKKVSIYFEGIYMNADVWLNGEHLGNHPYGYTAFEFDISDKIKTGEKNVLAVQVKNEGRNSRWYSGSGIYRHVWLNVTESVYIKPWGISITTPEVSSESAVVKIVSQIENETEENHQINISTRIINSSGKEVVTMYSEQQLNPDNNKRIAQNFEIEKPELWSVDAPDLYKAVVEIRNKNGKLLDSIEQNFGIRTIEFSVEKGFLLNGKSTLLKGACVHHDNGPLGSAALDRAEERRVELLKKSGFNAIRCAHNPPSEAFLDACDRLGMLVIDESFDMWRKPKNPQDYSNYFDEWWKKDVDAMVLRDRNHPSIIMWSIGNEIPERGDPEGAVTSGMLVEYIKTLDSTRPVTAAVNGLGPDKDPYFATLDISGYNYSFGGDHGEKSIFEKDHERIPERIMYCAESYPLEAFGSWMDAVKYPYVLGDFVWTGFDYLGEASIGWRGYPHDENYFPWNHAFCGDIDICGFKRPQSYYRDVIWEVGDKLSVFVIPPVPSFPIKENRASWSKWHWHDWVAEWNWEGFENQALEVVVCSGHEKAELFLNGKSLGVKVTNLENQWIANWEVPYQAGELKVVAFEGEKEVATSYLKTAKQAEKIKLTADRSEIKATGQDLSFIVVDLTDENGLLHPKTENIVRFEIEGPGEIIAVASSNPMSTESFQQLQRKAYKGRCLVIVKSGKESGIITLKADSEDLRSDSIKINVIN